MIRSVQTCCNPFRALRRRHLGEDLDEEKYLFDEEDYESFVKAQSKDISSLISLNYAAELVQFPRRWQREAMWLHRCLTFQLQSSRTLEARGC